MCNSSSFVSHPIKSTGWRISIAVLQLFLSNLYVFIVLYLSLLRKKRAWDSPAKRFGHFFVLYLAMMFLFLAIVNFSISSISSYNVAMIIVRYPVGGTYLYFPALLVALSLQLVAPFLPERVKIQCACRPRRVWFIEIIIHVIFILLMISGATASWMLCKHKCGYKDFNPKLEIIVVCFSIIILIISFAILVFTFIKFPNVNKRIKYVILKLVFVIVISISYIMVSITIQKNNTAFLLHIVFNFLLTLSIVSLNFPLHIWCYVCRLRKSQESRVPLLPINDTERQQTNPLSEWDHRNVPSYTATNLPFDMSDCRSDYRSIKSFSVLTPSVQYR